MEGRALPMVFSPSTCPLTLVFGPRTTGLVGDWWRTEAITSDDDASSPIRLNQQREAKERWLPFKNKLLISLLWHAINFFKMPF